MNLSKNFTLAELTSTSHADLLALNRMAADGVIILNLRALCELILQPLRDELGAMRVSSGFRFPELNVRVGGGRYSDHQWGVAADVVPLDVSPQALFLAVVRSILPYSQVIYEIRGSVRWVHVSLLMPWSKHERQALISPAAGVYRPYVAGEVLP